ncbi:MAG: site-specific integrase [Deltaproteobacteria bacterium]|nr:site-specific integrase [Deltaproteobacteria bacterium]
MAKWAKRPKGPEYRGLSRNPKNGLIRFERDRQGEKRISCSTKTTSWEEAVEFKRQHLEDLKLQRTKPTMPTLAEFVRRFLREDTDGWAATTRQDRLWMLAERKLSPAGKVPPLLPHLGHYRLDEISSSMLYGWWHEEVREKGRTAKTGREYLGALSRVFNYAIRRDIGITINPVTPVRREYAQKSGKKARAESDPGKDVRPIEDPAAIERLLDAATIMGLAVLVYVLLALDAGLRQAEALGLRWRHVGFGVDANDTSRHLWIEESRPRGGKAEPPKSGLSRPVELSRRLRVALLEYQLACGSPDPDARVLPFGPSKFRNQWAQICKRARVGHVRYKDLRDTYASQLLTAGVKLGHISEQLGHGNVAITARHYARWISGKGYRDPMRLCPGEVPADFLARLETAPDSHDIPMSEADSDPTLPPAWAVNESNPEVLGGGPSGTRTLDPRVKSAGLRTNTCSKSVSCTVWGRSGGRSWPRLASRATPYSPVPDSPRSPEDQPQWAGE